MKSFSGFALCALLCVIVPCLVSGACVISPPPRCDLMSPEVVTNLTFNGTCTNKAVVHLKMDSVYELNFTFTPVAKADYANSVVTVELGLGWEFPVNLSDPNACEGTEGLSCPLQANTSYSASFVFPTGQHSIFSAFPADIRWSLVNEPLQDQSEMMKEQAGDTYYKDLIFCLMLDAVIEPADAAVEDEGGDDDDDDAQPSFQVVP